MNDDTNTSEDRDLSERGLEHQGQDALDKLSGKVQESLRKLTGD